MAYGIFVHKSSGQLRRTVYYVRAKVLSLAFPTILKCFRKAAPLVWLIMVSAYVIYVGWGPRVKPALAGPDGYHFQRQVVEGLDFPKRRVFADHPHGEAAADRAGADMWIEAFSRLVTKRLYVYQKSNRDSKRAGEHVHIWPQDQMIPESYDTPHVDDLRCLVDVDYYVDMPNFLSDPKTTILYSMVPKRAGDCGTEGVSYYFEENRLKVNVSGGGEYAHELWDYKETFTVPYNNGYSRYFGFKKFVTYRTLRKQASTNHQIIVLVPICISSVKGICLTRLAPNKNGITRLDISTREQSQVTSVALEGKMHSVTLPTEIYEALGNLATKAQKLGVTVATVRNFLQKDTRTVDLYSEADATILSAVWNQTHDQSPTLIYPPGIHHFKYGVVQGNEKTSMSQFMDPIVAGMCFAPLRCQENEARAAKTRVTDVKSGEKLSHFTYKCALEFADLVHDGQANTIAPCSLDEVFEHQSKPSQVALLIQGALQYVIFATTWIKSFLKSEAYPDAKDPRIISTLDPSVKSEYAQYIYPLLKFFKDKPFYGFKTPEEVENRIVEMCANAKTGMAVGDLSRCDGHVSPGARKLQTLVLAPLIIESERKHFMDLQSVQYNRKARTTTGLSYTTGFSQASGSMDTSINNTVLNAFIIYYAWRLDGKPPAEAYSMIGIVGGDDSATPDLTKKLHEASCKAVGQVLKYDFVEKGKPGVNFLSRFYGPAVWYGDSNNCADIRRQLVKLHVTCKADVDPIRKAQEKARSLMQSDPNTPYLGHWARAVLSKYPVDDQNPDLRFWSYYARGGPISNRPDDWMWDFAREQLPTMDEVDLAARLARDPLKGTPSCVMDVPIPDDVDTL
jgi:hypothetical protein